MRTKRKKKNVRMRGSKTHGWGAKKKHRGSGHQGGVGNAGSGKRADQKKPTYLKNERVFGRHGFVRPNLIEVKAVNIQYLEQKYTTLKNKKLITEDHGFVVVDLKKLGFNKLLGTGAPKLKFKITAEYASPSAVKKIEEAGGQVTVLKKAETQKTDANSKE